MDPVFERAFDPLFLKVQEIFLELDRPSSGQGTRLGLDGVRRYRMELLNEFRVAESRVEEKLSSEWKSAEYALMAWVDSGMIMRLRDQEAEVKEFWRNEGLERVRTGQGRAHEHFFERAMDAEKNSQFNALEVYFLAVVFGFRGFYGDPDAAQKARRLNLPDTIEQWWETRRTALRQARPPEQALAPREPGEWSDLMGNVESQKLGLLLISLLTLVVVLAWATTVLKKPESNSESGIALNSADWLIGGESR
jgi:hypothetical protein